MPAGSQLAGFDRFGLDGPALDGIEPMPSEVAGCSGCSTGWPRCPEFGVKLPAYRGAGRQSDDHAESLTLQARPISIRSGADDLAPGRRLVPSLRYRVVRYGTASKAVLIDQLKKF